LLLLENFGTLLLCKGAPGELSLYFHLIFPENSQNEAKNNQIPYKCLKIFIFLKTCLENVSEKANR
jgi:hypothetical protein